MATVINPPMPYRGFLANGCRAGTLLQVSGFVPPHAQGFAINFKTGNGDIAFHLNPRFNDGVIVMNTQQCGNWGGEQRVASGPLMRGGTFELKILVENDKFMVALGGQHHCHFGHRVQKETINQVEVTGDVQVQFLSETNSYSPPPIMNPPVPFTTPLNGGFTPGKKLLIYGVMTGNGFSINVQSGYELFKNVGLHINPRMHEHSVTLNDCTNGGWGSEQKCALTISPGQTFAIEILCHPHAYEIRVNGVTLAQFPHRNIFGRPLQCLNALHITGDVMLQQVVL